MYITTVVHIFWYCSIARVGKQDKSKTQIMETKIPNMLPNDESALKIQENQLKVRNKSKGRCLSIIFKIDNFI